jgi:hypothetical protein
VKRMIRILAVAVLVAVILVASISPALARPRHHGQNLGEDHPSGDPHPSCVATKNAQNERGAQHVIVPESTPEREVGCWVVLPSHQGE